MDTVRLGRALKGYAGIEHCRGTLRLGTAGIRCGWALQGDSAIGHCRDTLPLSTAVWLRVEGKDNMDFQNLTTPLRGWEKEIPLSLPQKTKPEITEP